MQNNSSRKHYIDTVATLLIFTVFAVCIIIAILTGAKTYRRVSEIDSRTYDMRTCSQYIANKVRRASSPDMVEVVPYAGGNALRINESLESGDYCTYIYFYDGWIREFFSSASSIPSSADVGEKLIEIGSLDFSYDGGLLTANITPEGGKPRTLVLNIRGAEVVK